LPYPYQQSKIIVSFEQSGN